MSVKILTSVEQASKHLYLYLLQISIFVMTVLQQNGWKAGLVLRAFLASLPNQFRCPVFAWKEQTFTIYSIISQIPGASNTCYMLPGSAKSLISSANRYFLFLISWFVKCNPSSCIIQTVLLPACRGLWSSRFLIIWSWIKWKLKGKDFESANLARQLCHFIFAFFGLTTSQLEKQEYATSLKKKEPNIDWFPKFDS